MGHFSRDGTYWAKVATTAGSITFPVNGYGTVSAQTMTPDASATYAVDRFTATVSVASVVKGNYVFTNTDRWGVVEEVDGADVILRGTWHYWNTTRGVMLNNQTPPAGDTAVVHTGNHTANVKSPAGQYVPAPEFREVWVRSVTPSVAAVAGTFVILDPSGTTRLTFDYPSSAAGASTFTGPWRFPFPIGFQCIGAGNTCVVNWDYGS